MLLSKHLIKVIEKRSRSFLWGDAEEGKKMHLLSWDCIVQDKKEGGLGIKNFRKQNEAFIMKLC